MAPSHFPLPFEHVRRQTRRYALSDFRFVAFRRGTVTAEIALHDVSTIDVEPSLLERLTGAGTLVARSARVSHHDVRIRFVPRARREALRLELLLADARGVPPRDEVARLPLTSFWPIRDSLPLKATLVAPAILLLAFIGIGIGLSGHNVSISYPDDDPVRPRGVRRPDAEVVAFMERDVLPWARQALAPIVGRGNVTCETCHGENAARRRWVMPAVQALPEPAVRAVAEAAGSDPEMRNALHGYLAEGDNQARAAYMRGVVMPGMAQLLRRPVYDFSQSYEYNRSRAALGCYHCHMVGELTNGGGR
jgi:Bacterial PH domain